MKKKELTLETLKNMIENTRSQVDGVVQAYENLNRKVTNKHNLNLQADLSTILLRRCQLEQLHNLITALDYTTQLANLPDRKIDKFDQICQLMEQISKSLDEATADCIKRYPSIKEKIDTAFMPLFEGEFIDHYFDLSTDENRNFMDRVRIELNLYYNNIQEKLGSNDIKNIDIRMNVQMDEALARALNENEEAPFQNPEESD